MVEITPASNTGRSDPSGEEADGGISVERREKYSAVCKWLIPAFSKLKQRTTRCLWSKYFEVGGYDCRLLVYPAGDSQALPGYISIYLQVTDPKNASGKWDCFASYRLCVANQGDESKSISRDSWHRFSAKRKSHGWCDFAQSSVVLDSSSGFAINDTILVTADILVLSETTQFVRDNEMSALSGSSAGTEVLSGKFTWKVRNFGIFQEMIKTQKIMSPAFSAGECSLRLSVYQSAVNNSDYLSMCLESKDTEKGSGAERSCWCLFRMSVLSQVQGARHMHRDSYGRFAADSKAGDNTSLGWNDFMSVSAFTDPAAGYFLDDTAIFSASYHIIKESSTFNRSFEKGAISKGRNRLKGGAGDAYQGKFTWKIEHFTRLKELLKKRKITGLCIKSRRFQVGSRDCRLIVYPRGQSQPPNHLSMFLEVTDPTATAADWSCFVSHRLSVVNQRAEDKSVAKESQNRYSKQAKDWGWREFVTLTSLFDLDAGFLVNDCVVFAAEVLVLRESSELKALPAPSKKPLLLEGSSNLRSADEVRPKLRFSWRIENFMAFKEIMETRKIFSKYFTVEGCDLRIGVYESFDTLCIYLESDAFGSGLERNFWVKYRIAVVNQKYADRTEWKESSICTKTWNNSVLQFMKVTEMTDPESGYVARDGLLVACEVIDCQPWFDFADLDVLVSNSEAETMSVDPDEILDSDDSDILTAEEEDTFRSLLGDVGLHLVDTESKPGLDARDLQQVLSDKMEMNIEAAVSFVAGLRMYLADDAFKVKRLLQSGHSGESGEAGVCLLDLLMGIEALQQPLVDLLLDTLLQLCHQQPKARLPGARMRRQALPGPPPGVHPSLAANSRFSLDGREDGECASSSAPMPSTDYSGASAKPSSPPTLAGAESSSSGTTTPQEASASAEASPEACQAHLQDHIAAGIVPEAGRNGARGPAGGRDKAEELIQVALRWLATVCPQSAEPRGQGAASGGLMVHKVQALLHDLPRPLQSQLIMVVPNLLDPSSHTAVAGILLAHLADAHQQGAAIERELRLPVLSALGQLHINPAVAEKVLHTALDSLPVLSDLELPPAVGLVLKLASESGSAREAAVHAVRSRVRLNLDESAGGSLDAVRLAVSQNPNIAAAMLADIDAECRSAKAASPESETRDPSGNMPSGLHGSDLEVLLDLLSHPALAEKARATFERGIARGLLNEIEVAIVLEQRRMRTLASTSRVQAEAEEFLSSLERSSSLRMDSLVMSGGAPGPFHPGFPHNDDTDAVLGLAEVMAVSKNQKARTFAASLYQTLFRVNSEENKRGRMLRGLVSRASVGSALQQAQSKDRSASGNPPNNRPAPVNGRNAHVSRSPRGVGAREAQGNAADARQEMDVTTPEGLLLTLISQQGSAARPAVVLMMLEAQAANAKAASLSKRVHELESGQEKASKEAKAGVQKQKQEAQRLADRLSETEAQMAQLRSDHSNEAAGFADTKRELEERVRNLERELDWVRGEREEERVAMAHDRREAAARLKEAESSSNRLKSARRDDLKRVTRERAQAIERSKELESAHAKLEEELRRLRSLIATSTATQDSLSTRLDEQERNAAATISQHEEQAVESEKRIKELEASLSEREAFAAGIEAQLREETARTATLFGSNLERLSAAQLDGLARIHERGLKQARTLMIQRRSEESAAATAVAAANAVTGGPPPRAVAQRGSPGGAPSVPQRSASSVGSLDSLKSLGLDPPISAGMRGLAPSHRAPGAGQTPTAMSSELPALDYHGQGMQGLQRSMTPGIASYYAGPNSGQPGGFAQANAALPNGFPNGLLSGTGLLNGKQSSGNGMHRLW